MSDIFKFLSVRLRLRVLNLLLTRPLCVSDLQRVLEVGQSGVSKRLRELLQMELVTYTKKGNVHVYSVVKERSELYMVLWKLVRAWSKHDPELQTDIENLDRCG